MVSQRVKIEELMKIFNISYKTVYNWLNRWEHDGMLGLYNKSGRGRKRTFNSQQEEQIRDWTREDPRQSKKVVQKIKENWNIDISADTIKRILKSLSMS
jgi:transposase